VVSLDTDQLDQLRRIGAFLAEVRGETGRTLEEIATKTYIPLRLLKAIETGQEQVLPEPVFVQGFIRRYGDALGLDGNELAKQFPIHNDAMSPLPTHDAKPVASEAPVYAPVQNTPIWQPSELPPSRPPYFLIGGAALLALAGLFFIVIQPNLKPSAPVAKAPAAPIAPVAPPVESVAAPSVEPSVALPSPAPVAASPTVSPAPIAVSPTAPSPTGNNPVAIAVNLSEESWLQVVVDGKVEYEGTLEKGAKQSWSGKERIVISSGNAGAVAIAFNNGQSKKMGELGAVEDKTFTTKGEQ
jgi:cytoskeleton protein RodZ